MNIEFSEEFAASGTDTKAGLLILLSRSVKDQIQLLMVKNIEQKVRISVQLKLELSNVTGLLPLNGVQLRSNLSSNWGAIMTEHVMRVQKYLNRDSGDVVAFTAWRYSTLTSWGEASAARELAHDMGIPVTTVHNRLRLARERGILASPGTGARFG